MFRVSLLLTTAALATVALSGCSALLSVGDQLDQFSASTQAPADAKGGQSDDAILAELVQLTDAADPGATKDYYWTNGTAEIDRASMPARGTVLFTHDDAGRPSVASCSLTYAQYTASAGSRQGSPLNPPTGWPAHNPEVAVGPFALTGKTYHGYLWNRSHSCADSLAGALSYTSADNFTAGTRTQNVGADQNGGMRAPEEYAENYWKAHPGSTATLWYTATPLYRGTDAVPRGTIVDVLSSDGAANQEFVVINDAEGWSIDYTNSTSTAR